MVNHRSLFLTLSHSVGTLKSSLDVLSRNKVNLTKIESKPVRHSKEVFNFVVDVDEDVSNEQLDKAITELKQSKYCNEVKLLGGKSIPWFPRKLSDIDYFSSETLEAGAELESDHPGFTDSEYRNRRKHIAEIAKTYKINEPIPKVAYAKSEIDTWRIIYNELTALYPTYACEQYNYIFPLLMQNCGYSENNIPQLEDVSQFLQGVTGFRLRPVSGLLSARDFLNGLAFRVFHSTQYIRHHSVPFYTPEPDLVHELLGHAPLFADSDFADFSQQIGLASLGASDEDIEKLVRLYWYTVEFGVCVQNDKDGIPRNKAYGAGLLSSFGELKYSIDGIDVKTGNKPEYRPFDPEVACNHVYPITTYQPVYYVANSFDAMKDQMRKFASTKLNRPFALRYNPFTLSVDVLDSEDKLLTLTGTIQSNIDNLKYALEKIRQNKGLSFEYNENK
ncbi:phenylalanine 4-monooxygenase [Naegleria gruberi]|uniref:phenylalanine 4-monooxygenase n=1 Tax=Naegleria gruberi TaxID=5762 RepID=D2UZG6_NAEGR|nr:phenylalanine 4-monooxygenase [Naegleria gruberi]EFC50145.1 phenylalanine 4-monooxygenase [Naegleria gruberi]|eukprot:XP_002682889.1 phenylalanine 4-monooxygenase [Naegleria gruberi strain NEG-M]